MTNTVGVFYYEIDVHGARVTTRKEPICPGCLSDGEVDAQILLLKDDLDSVAARMKLAIRKYHSKSVLGDN